MFEAFFAALLVGGWTLAWLNWMFYGQVRAWLIAFLFPAAWRVNTSRESLTQMTGDELLRWLALTAKCPWWTVKLLTCHYCLSAHIALLGSLAAVAGGLPWTCLPLTWAAGAALAHFAYRSPPEIVDSEEPAQPSPIKTP